MSTTNSNTDARIFALNSIELLAAIFRGPDAEQWAALSKTGMPELLAQSDSSSELAALNTALTNSLSTPEGISQLETEYVRLFIAAGGGIAAPLYQSCHQGENHVMGDSALAMRDRLDQAGLEVALDSNEPPDHISIQLEYLYHLLASAWSGETPPLEAEGRAFAAQTMLPWATLFCDALAKADASTVYACAGKLTVATLTDLGS